MGLRGHGSQQQGPEVDVDKNLLAVRYTMALLHIGYPPGALEDTPLGTLVGTGPFSPTAGGSLLQPTGMYA